MTLGNFNDAAPLFGSDTKQFIGITNYPTTPIPATRQMPPLAYPQPKMNASAFNSNGVSASSQQSVAANSRTYNNNNSNAINNNNNNNTAINSVNSYQAKSSGSALLQPPPPQSRANNNIASNNSFARPSEAKPLNGRSNYASGSQLGKHEVNCVRISDLHELRL